MKRRTQGQNGIAGLKIDVSKAYDRLKWSFLQAMMQKFGFTEIWIDRVMRIVQSVSYSFLHNGVEFGNVNPKRGLCQGDPISPYLYIMSASLYKTLYVNANTDHKMSSSQQAYTSLPPTSQLAGSVPAVITEHEDTSTSHVPGANLNKFPPNNNGGQSQGYQTMATPSDGNEQPFVNSWRGVFSISSYMQYFNVDTDIVLNRVTSSLFPNGDFFSKIDANPDLYGLVWISTTLVFLIASLGNCATYLMLKTSDINNSWSFDVNYVNMAAVYVYGYALVVPLLLLVIPVEFIRWTIIMIAGAASSSFVTLNLRSCTQNDLAVVLAAACVLQYGLAFVIKMWFFA
ncbi:hypothetical protein AgCh_016974 [Apium graveolens]